MEIESLVHSKFLYIRSTFPSESKFNVFYNLLLCSEKKSIHPKMLRFSTPGNYIRLQATKVYRMQSPTGRIQVKSSTVFLPLVNTSFVRGIAERTPLATSDKVEFLKESEWKRGWPQATSAELKEGWLGEKLTGKS